jgi:hypothetical protein
MQPRSGCVDGACQLQRTLDGRHIASAEPEGARGRLAIRHLHADPFELAARNVKNLKRAIYRTAGLDLDHLRAVEAKTPPVLSATHREIEERLAAVGGGELDADSNDVIVPRFRQDGVIAVFERGHCLVPDSRGPPNAPVELRTSQTKARAQPAPSLDRSAAPTTVIHQMVRGLPVTAHAA